MLSNVPYRRSAAPARHPRIAAPPQRPGAALWAWVLDHVDAAALQSAGQSFIISRAILVIVTYLTVALQLSFTGLPHRVPATWWDAWYQWDARWYLRIATGGYQWHGLQHYSSVAFFPLYPILIMLLALAVPISGKIAAITVANVTFFLALFFLDRLVRRECGPEVAQRTVLYLALFPTALFFFAGYSESPFLLWTVLSVSAMRQRRWAWAGLWGFLATATHATGLALVAPFAAEWYQAHGLSRRLALLRARRGSASADYRRMLRRGAWVALIPLGIAPFALYLGLRFGNPLLFDQVQRAWHRTIAWPWVGPIQALKDISLTHIASYAVAHNLIDVLCTFGFAALIAAGWRRMPRSFSLYAAASLLMTLINPDILDGYYLPLRSTTRFCLVLFPCFITLALLGHRPWVDRLIMALSPAALAIFTIVFLLGGWVA